MATDPTRILSADDVVDLLVPDDATGFEFVDRTPVLVMPASPIHGWLITEVGYRLRLHVERAGLAGRVYSDASFILALPDDPERMRAPDVAYVRRDRVDAHTDPARPFRCVPDLAIEIDLTSAKKPGGQQRILDYLRAGVPLVWAIDPHSHSAIAYRPDGSARLLREDDMLDAEEVVPGFRLSLAELFH